MWRGSNWYFNYSLEDLALSMPVTEIIKIKLLMRIKRDHLSFIEMENKS